jgi:Iron/manganese superoxide dismutases, C-terminal domain
MIRIVAEREIFALRQWLIRHLYRKVINKIPLPLVRIRNYPSPELIGRVAPTRTEGINLRGVFRFPVELKQKIDAAFGSVDACRKEFSATASAEFGSGGLSLGPNDRRTLGPHTLIGQ